MNPDSKSTSVPRRVRPPVERWLSKKIRVPIDEVPGWFEGESYFTIPLDGVYEVHLPPQGDNLLVWIVDVVRNEAVVWSKIDAGRMFEEGWADELAQTVATASEDTIDLSDESICEFRERVSETIPHPFDRNVVEKLRRPTVEWFESRLLNVEAAEDRGRTMWAVEMEGDWGNELRFEYPTAEITKMFPGRFPQDFRRGTDHTPALSNDLWFLWFDIVMGWLDSNVIVREYDEDDLRDDSPEDYDLRRSGSGTYHVCDRATGTPACGYGFDPVGERRDLDLDALPVSSVICSHCSVRMTELQIGQTLRRM